MSKILHLKKKMVDVNVSAMFGLIFVGFGLIFAGSVSFLMTLLSMLMHLFRSLFLLLPLTLHFMLKLCCTCVRN